MTRWNLPNILSLSRIIMAPVVMLFLTVVRDDFGTVFGVSMSMGDIIAGAVFILASITDAVDGYVARKRSLVTNLGKFIDPIADKILVVTALISLVELGALPAWMVVIIVSREFIVSGIRMVAAAEGVVIHASLAGKAKTVSQIIAIVMMIFGVRFARPAMWVALVMTVWSGLDYLIKGKDFLR